MDAALLRIEDEGELPEEERAAVLRALHTLKGNAGMLGRTELSEAVHDLEPVFKEMPAKWDREMLDRLFEMAAALRRAAERVGAEDEEEASERLAKVRKGIEQSHRHSREGGSSPVHGAGEQRHSEDTARLTLDSRLRGNDEDSGNDGGDREDEADADAPAADADALAADAAGELVRVPFASLDALLNRVGELVTLETRVEQLVRKRRGELEEAGVRRPLEDAAERLARLSGSLHETTIELRLVPVRRVFERFPSVVRDLARQQGKRVRVEIEGADVRIDKGMADSVSEPLLHLVRNAVDHGIEPPDAREAEGRDPTGTVRLRAERTGDRVRISVEDDGRGLDRAGIKARAVDLQLLDEDEPLDMAAAGDMIFQPGFSTRTEATTVSGRGVGLDVVRRKALALRGSLAVESPDGGGTRFVLDLPLTMAIIPALLFEAAGEVMAFAAADVVETLGSVATERAGGAEVVRRGDDLVPVARIGRLFGWQEPGSADSSERFAVIVRRGKRRLAVLADRLVDQRDVVVKPLPRGLGALPAVSGVAVTHEGSVVLLLDVAGILDLNLDSYRRKSRGT